MAEAAITAFGSVDILINNAGVAVRGLLENMAMPDWNSS
jgi:NADP-dependent 3-hydroxy acid dehydrogenase YdfG